MNGGSAARLRDRYREEEAPAPTTWNATLDLLLAHRSVRAFMPEPLPDGALETIVAAASSAPSSSNLQVWSVVAVEDPARKHALATLAAGQRQIDEAPLFLVWLLDLARLTRLAELREDRSEALDHLETFILGVVDTALAAQNAVIALESLGLGSVYIGAIRNRPVEVARTLALPPKVFPLFGLAVGRPDPARPASVKPRLPQDAVLHREAYGWAAVQTAAVARHDEALRAFQREQGLPEIGWTAQAGARTRDAASMSGRHEMRAWLAELGFLLK